MHNVTQTSTATDDKQRAASSISYNFVLLKPEAMRFEREVSSSLSEATSGLVVPYRVGDWTKISRAIYDSQFRDTPLHKFQFECYAQLTRSLFGNKTMLYEIRPSDQESASNLDAILIDCCIELSQWKTRIRQKLDKNLQATKITLRERDFFTSYSHTMELPEDVLSSPEVVRTLQSNHEEEYVFKYVHVSDPILTQIKMDIASVSRSGVIQRV